MRNTYFYLEHCVSEIFFQMLIHAQSCVFFFFFNDTATTEIYTLSLHDALPISSARSGDCQSSPSSPATRSSRCRSEEHTSELQSHHDLVCRLLLEKKKKKT